MLFNLQSFRRILLEGPSSHIWPPYPATPDLWMHTLPYPSKDACKRCNFPLILMQNRCVWWHLPLMAFGIVGLAVAGKVVASFSHARTAKKVETIMSELYQDLWILGISYAMMVHITNGHRTMCFSSPNKTCYQMSSNLVKLCQIDSYLLGVVSAERRHQLKFSFVGCPLYHSFPLFVSSTLWFGKVFSKKGLDTVKLYIHLSVWKS